MHHTQSFLYFITVTYSYLSYFTVRYLVLFYYFNYFLCVLLLTVDVSFACTSICVLVNRRRIVKSNQFSRAFNCGPGIIHLTNNMTICEK